MEERISPTRSGGQRRLMNGKTVPINPTYTERELGYLLKDADPIAVIYDTDLTATMPPWVAAASGLTAVAHCVEALCYPDTPDGTQDWAREGLLLPQPCVGLLVFLLRRKPVGTNRSTAMAALPRFALLKCEIAPPTCAVCHVASAALLL